MHAGLRVPYVFEAAPSLFERTQTLKDVDAFVVRFSGSGGPPFLLPTDPYPECAGNGASNGTMC